MTIYEFYNEQYQRKLTNKIYTQPYYNELLELTNFLPENSHYSERIYCILHGIETRPICEQCGGSVNFPHHLRKEERMYRRFCSSKCSNNNKNVQNEKSKTCMINYGVDNPSKSKEIHNLKIETINRNYGGFAMQSPSLKHTIQQTNILKFGHSSPTKSKYIKRKIQISHLNRSKKDIELSNIKRKNTMIIKYGIDHNPITKYSKAATSYIKNFITINNINPKLCLYSDEEFSIRDSNKLYFLDLVVFKTHEGIQSKNINDISIILEYDGAFWHPNINQSISYRDIPMMKNGLTYREKFLYDKRKELFCRKLMNKNGGKYIKYKEYQITRILP